MRVNYMGFIYDLYAQGYLQFAVCSLYDAFLWKTPNKFVPRRQLAQVGYLTCNM
jgi:hypothetical protein